MPLWSIANRIIQVLGAEGARSRDGLEEDADGARQTDVGVGRFKTLDVDPRVRGFWREVLDYSKHLRAGRRASSVEAPRGNRLWSRLSKANADC